MSGIETWLQRSAGWSFASLALQAPDQTTVDAMAALIPSLDAELQPVAAPIVTTPLDQWEPEYFSVLGPGGCPASESSYERAAIASRGPLIADVAGWYAAFAYAPDVREVPDHAAVEFGFVAYLALKNAFAIHQERADYAGVTADAYVTFSATHLSAWIGEFCATLKATESPLYVQVAAYIDALERRRSAEETGPSADGLAPVVTARCR